MKPDVIFVLGMHRSGTSALTRGLQALGIHLGDHLLPPVSGDNEKGYYEDVDLHDLDNDLLKASGRTWDSLYPPAGQLASSEDLVSRGIDVLRSKMASNRPFALKDPRLCLLLPWWQKRCLELQLVPGYVLAVRHPLSVATSLCRPGTTRGDVRMIKALWLWYLHMTCALKYSAGGIRLAVDYDALIDNPRAQLKRVCTAFEITGQEPDAAFCDHFFESRLRHFRYSRKECLEHPDVHPRMARLYALLDDLAHDHVVEGSDLVTAATSEADVFLGHLAPLLQYVNMQESGVAANRHKATLLAASCQELEATVAAVRTEKDELRSVLDSLLTSRSWRLTAPLRWFVNLLK
jgi:hypothetical protein